MHVGFLSLEYPLFPSGGIGTSIRNLGRALVRHGHRVTVLGWGRNASFEDQGVEVRFQSHDVLPKTGWLANRLSMQRQLRHMVDREGLDIVEAHDWCGPSAGIKPTCPLVIRCNGSAVFFGHLLHEQVRPSVQMAERLALMKADAIGAVSRFAAETTSRLFELKQPIAIVPNGVDISQFAPASPEDTESETVVYVGTIVRKKGILDLCRAFSRVVSEMPDARLIVVGRDTPDSATGEPSTWALCERELSEAARARVELPGPQPYEGIQDIVHRATVCVFPSYAEALPLAWLEAMACAKPIVAYDIGWASEIVEPERTGLLAPLGDDKTLGECILRVLRDPAFARTLGRAGRSVVEARFSADVAAARTMDWYRGVLQAR